eukprot:5422496-Prymnesium_polylepis.1
MLQSLPDEETQYSSLVDLYSAHRRKGLQTALVLQVLGHRRTASSSLVFEELEAVRPKASPNDYETARPVAGTKKSLVRA